MFLTVCCSCPFNRVHGDTSTGTALADLMPMHTYTGRPTKKMTSTLCRWTSTSSILNCTSLAGGGVTCHLLVKVAHVRYHALQRSTAVGKFCRIRSGSWQGRYGLPEYEHKAHLRGVCEGRQRDAYARPATPDLRDKAAQCKLGDCVHQCAVL